MSKALWNVDTVVHITLDNSRQNKFESENLINEIFGAIKVTYLLTLPTNITEVNPTCL